LDLADGLLFGPRLAAGPRGARGASARALIFDGGGILAAVDRLQRRHQGEEIRRGFVVGFVVGLGAGAVLAARPVIQEGRSAARRFVLRLIGAFFRLIGIARAGVVRVCVTGAALLVAPCAGVGSGGAGLLFAVRPGVVVGSHKGLAGSGDQQGEQEEHDDDRQDPPPRVHAAPGRAGIN
jgi:hypothetical protein